MPFTEESARRLQAIARESIQRGLDQGEPLAIDLDREPAALRELRAAFVTLHLNGRLRGCIGSLEARWPLAEEVARRAYSAAFEDPRFPAVTRDEASALDIHISVLTPTEPLPCRDEADLLQKLRPGRDGLLLEEGRHRATFLPAVWSDLPDPRQFLIHLKRKANLDPGYWSTTLRFWRYETESISAQPPSGR